MGFVHNENLKLYRWLVGEAESNPGRDEGRHKPLVSLLAEDGARQASRPVRSAL